MNSWITNYLETLGTCLDSLDVPAIAEIVELLASCHSSKRAVLCFGNGGSAATASHFVSDLSHTLAQATGVPFRALSLVDNACWLTATSNDLSFEDVFLCQIKALSDPGDVVFGLSVSGSSPNFVSALEWASKNNRHTVALVGRNGGALKALADHVIVVDESHYGRVEDVHGVICHVISFALAAIGKKDCMR